MKKHLFSAAFIFLVCLILLTLSVSAESGQTGSCTWTLDGTVLTISGSGATAVFILESAVIKGLKFNSVWSIGNGKQIGIEDVLQYMISCAVATVDDYNDMFQALDKGYLSLEAFINKVNE